MIKTVEDVDVTADGAWLVLDSDLNDNADIYTMRASGGEPIQSTASRLNQTLSPQTNDPLDSFQGGRRAVCFAVSFSRHSVDLRDSCHDTDAQDLA